MDQYQENIIYFQTASTSQEPDIELKTEDLEIKRELTDEPEESLLIKKEPNLNITEDINPTTNCWDINVICEDKFKINQLLQQPQLNQKIHLGDPSKDECNSARCFSSFIKWWPDDVKEDDLCEPSSSANMTEVKPIKENKFICSLCHYKTEKKHNLNLHIQGHIKQTDDDLLKQPVINHIEEKKFNCILCDYKGFKSSDLTIHMKKHRTANQELHCSFCDYKTSVTGSLRKHIKIHTGEKNFHCHLCDYKSLEKRCLKLHIKTHTGERDYQCTLCDYKATQYNHLRRHIKMHTGVKDFHCNLCDYRSSHNCNLKRHMETHNKQITKPTRELKFHCNLCDYKAAYNSSLKLHIKNHTGEMDFHCNLCDYKSVKNCNLKRHMKIHTKLSS